MTSKKAPKRRAVSHSTAEFEEFLKEASGREQYVLILFVTGTTPRSSQAISNIHALCEEYCRVATISKWWTSISSPARQLSNRLLRRPP